MCLVSWLCEGYCLLGYQDVKGGGGMIRLCVLSMSDIIVLSSSRRFRRSFRFGHISSWLS